MRFCTHGLRNPGIKPIFLSRNQNISWPGKCPLQPEERRLPLLVSGRKIQNYRIHLRMLPQNLNSHVKTFSFTDTELSANLFENGNQPHPLKFRTSYNQYVPHRPPT